MSSSKCFLSAWTTLVVMSGIVTASVHAQSAEEDPTSAQADTEQQPSTEQPSTEQTPTERTEPELEDADDPVGRVILESLVGSAVLVAGVAATYGVINVSCASSEVGICLLGVLGGGILGLATVGLMPLAVTGTGNALGGHGNVWGAYLGLAAGGLLTLGAVGLAEAIDQRRTGAEGYTAIIAGSILPVLGTVIGFELSSTLNRSRSREQSRVSLLPSVAVSPQAVSVSLAGLF